MAAQCAAPGRPNSPLGFRSVQKQSTRAPPTVVRACYGFTDPAASAKAERMGGPHILDSELLPPADVRARGGWVFIQRPLGADAKDKVGIHCDSCCRHTL
jgi:hypothetical protein